MQRDVQVNGVAVFILCLTVLHPATANMLGAKANHILTPKRDEPQEVKREAGLCADRMSRLILSYLIIGPCVMPWRAARTGARGKLLSPPSRHGLRVSDP